MSSPLAPATLSPNNPINQAAVTITLAKLGLAARDRDVADYTSLLKDIWEIWKNTVLDNALLLQAIAGADGSDDRQQAGCPFPRQVPHYPSLAKTGVKGLRICRLSEGLDRPLADKRVSDLVVKAAKALAELGAVVDELSVPFHKEASDVWAVFGRMSATRSLLDEDRSRRQLCLNDLTQKVLPLKQEQLDVMFPTGLNMIINGLRGSDNMPPTLVGNATNLLRNFRDAYNATPDNYDVLVMPTLPFLPPKLPAKEASVAKLMVTSARLSLNTSPATSFVFLLAISFLTGMPALSLPEGLLSHALGLSAILPVGMQIVGKFYAEPIIHRVAYAWEQTYEWKTFA